MNLAVLVDQHAATGGLHQTHDVLSWWLADLDVTAALAPNPAEVASVHWIAPDELLELPELLSSNREFLQAVLRGEILLGRGPS